MEMRLFPIKIHQLRSAYLENPLTNGEVVFVKLHQMRSNDTVVGGFSDLALCNWWIFRTSTSQLVDFHLERSYGYINIIVFQYQLAQFFVPVFIQERQKIQFKLIMIYHLSEGKYFSRFKFCCKLCILNHMLLSIFLSLRHDRRLFD